jgi:hypothetical protein
VPCLAVVDHVVHIVVITDGALDRVGQLVVRMGVAAAGGLYAGVWC